jgi:uncharacterized membrane protein
MNAAFVRVRNHLVTGFIFVMPVLIALAVIMKFWDHLLKIGAAMSKLLSVGELLGPSGDAVMAVVFSLLVCAAAGYLVRVSFLKRVSERVDAQLNGMFPGYRQLRTQTTKRIGVAAEEEEPRFEACLIKVQELWQPGYVIEQNPDGTVTVFVPQAPAGAQGQLYVALPGQLRRLGFDSVALGSHLRRYGKGMLTTQVGVALQ